MTNNNLKATTLKGFRDFPPSQALQRQWLEKKIRRIFELWGYDPIETPTLESLGLFSGQIGEDEKLFFSFEDQGGRQVALRYDQTVPTCRFVGQNRQQLAFPFKRYQIQPAFRAEKPQKGRYREFLQCDADIFGLDSPLADAELIALSLDIFRRLGFPKAKVLINDRQLLKDIPYPAIAAIDKLNKIGPSGVIKEMIGKGINENDAKQYLQTIQNLKPNQTINTILDYLKQLGFPSDWYQFDPTIARSFSYSTGPIWEVVIPGFDGGSVLGGERFDKLVLDISGQEVPATGFGLGFDRTLEAAIQLGIAPQFSTLSSVLISPLDSNSLSYSLAVSQQLRDAGINTELYPDPNTKIQKQLKYANKKGIPFVAIIGDQELKDKTVTLKDMTKGAQETLLVSELVSKLSS
ncbi:histidine--tRNA ligase [Candidatus Chazhemtobacterium aquaticus]|uniref:Histidine--tRNA ligase n=1 Tax=Candidatus Chazhemtobacterium aquaticus TaxID=2715735 RepID=A0A857N6B4_9BACT|nr:histidine--tRNA ligase [Candidatus Chazhemtobacterium aquaticus]QHO63697.1 Histidyl-tRNA synthetase [Candidatus Chazhemtobacterium aquaticus]